jgi:sirohydrochlorin cobaltochelatase
MEKVLCIIMCVVSVLATTTVNAWAGSSKRAILVVSFGTSYADTRAVTIEACEQKIAETFPDYEVRRAFTSNIIIKILKERDNILVDTPEEALQKLQEEGFSEAIVQPLHIIPGSEFHDVVQVVNAYKSTFESIRLGVPLLATTEDYMATAEALKTQLPELKDDEAVVFMGHGTHHPANASYPALQQVLEDQGIKNVFVGTVEGYPELEHIIARLQAQQIKKVTLMPFMLVAGDHAQNDMAGDEEDSWKMLLKKEGFVVDTYLHGLGENPAIQELYIKHIQDAIKGEEHLH